VVCLLDPEGDYRTLAEHEGIVVLRSEAGTEEARAREVEDLLRHRSTSVAIDLSALDRAERIRAAARFLHAVQGLRGSTGAPHWVVMDEAHHLFPTGGGRAEETLGFEWRGICLVSHEPERLAPELLGTVGHVLSTSIGPVTRALPLLGRDAIPGGELAAREALDIALAVGRPPGVRRVPMALRETDHTRHVVKDSAAKQ